MVWWSSTGRHWVLLTPLILLSVFYSKVFFECCTQRKKKTNERLVTMPGHDYLKVQLDRTTMQPFSNRCFALKSENELVGRWFDVFFPQPDPRWLSDGDHKGIFRLTQTYDGVVLKSNEYLDPILCICYIIQQPGSFQSDIFLNGSTQQS